MNPIALEPHYKEFIHSYSKEQTRESYANSLAYLRKLLGKEVFDANDVELEDVFKRLRDKGLTGAYLRTLKGSMNSFFKYEVDHHNRKDNPAGLAMKFDTGKGGSPNPKALTQVQKDKVLSVLKWDDTLQEKKISLAVLFGFYEGFRRFEIAKCQISEVEWEKNRIKVIGKGRDKDHPDYVPLSNTLGARLKDYLACVDKAGIDTRYIFFHPDNPNTHVSRFVIGNWFKIVGKRCGFDKSVKWSSHSGRHQFCSLLNEKGIAPIDAIKMSRHKSVDLYASRYVKIEEEITQKKFKSAIP